MGKYLWIIVIGLLILWIWSEDKKRRERHTKGKKNQERQSLNVRKAVDYLYEEKDFYVPADTQGNPLRRGMFGPDTPSDVINELYADGVENAEDIEENYYEGPGDLHPDMYEDEEIKQGMEG